VHDLTIADTAIRQDAEGRYCLNDLHRAAGGEKRHQPTNWLRLDATKALMGEIDHSSDLRSANAINGGTAPGTYVVKELVYAYAMWISPAFHLKVIRAYDAMVTAPPPLNPANLSRLQLIELAMQAEQERLAIEAKLAIAAPKAEALDRIATADGSLCLTDAAKELQVRPKDLIGYLSSNHWIYKRAGGTNWIAYQDRIQSGVLEHKSVVLIDAEGRERIRDQVRVTAKGLARLSELLGGGRQAA
jgi:phage antirepressor YoqD-like protein